MVTAAELRDPKVYKLVDGLVKVRITVSLPSVALESSSGVMVTVAEVAPGWIVTELAIET